jgi:hypothetical protein
MLRACLISCVLIAGACTPEGPAEEAAEALPHVAAPAEAADADDLPRYFGQEAFTVVMEVSGPETGTVIYHYRDWGRKHATLKTTRSTRTSSTTDRREFTDGIATVVVNNLTGEVRAIENPPRSAEDEMHGVATDKFAEAYAAQNGDTATGEQGSFGGHACTYWTTRDGRVCMAPWGAKLYSLQALGGVQNEEKAIEVRIGDGGPDSAFVYQPPADAPKPQ